MGSFGVIMKVYKMSDMQSGWFVGDFEPSAYRTSAFEVNFRTHSKDEIWDVHYHTDVVEINYLHRGKMKLQDQVLVAGDIFVLHPFEIADPIFLEDCEICCVKTPSRFDKVSVVVK